MQPKEKRGWLEHFFGRDCAPTGSPAAIGGITPGPTAKGNDRIDGRPLSRVSQLRKRQGGGLGLHLAFQSGQIEIRLLDHEELDEIKLAAQCVTYLTIRS